MVRRSPLWAAGLLLWAGRAQAWTWDLAPLTPLPSPVQGVEVVPHQYGDVILALGDGVSWLVDPSTGEQLATLPVGARDAVLVDISGDGQRDLVLCGPAGIQVVPWEGLWKGTLQRLDTRACEAVAVVETADGTRLAAAGVDLRLYSLPGDWTLVQEAVVEIPQGERSLLAAEGELVAASAVGATEIVEWSPRGTSTLATGGPIGGLALGPWGWSWTVPEKSVVADMTHRTVPTDPGPGTIVSGDVDRDGQRDLVVLHAEGLATFLLGTGAQWSRATLDEPASSAIVRDVDADGCDDVVLGVAEPPGIRVLHTTGCASALDLSLMSDPGALYGETEGDGVAADEENRGAAPDIDLGWPGHEPIERPPELLGVSLPWFLGDRAARDPERMRTQQYVVVGSGWAMGGALKNVYLQIPFFPALSVEMEWGSPRVRWLLGGDSAALFLWMADEGSGIHLVNATTGVTFGSPRLRVGPFITGGLVNFGAGWRTVFTPWDDGDTFKGIEVRLTWFYPYTGEVMVLYVWSQPMREPRRRTQPTWPPPEAEPLPQAVPLPEEVATAEEHVADAVAEVPESETGNAIADDADLEPDRTPIRGRDDGKQHKSPAFFSCRSMGFSVGAAGGASSTRFSWEYVGSDVPLSPSVSPAIAAQCETGKGIGMMIGFETAPFYSYLTKNDDRLHQMGSHTFGIMVGGEGFRIGPTATAGIWTLGAGLRTAIKLREDRQGLIHQLDLRAAVHYPSAPAGQVMLLYGVAFSPWR